MKLKRLFFWNWAKKDESKSTNPMSHKSTNSNSSFSDFETMRRSGSDFNSQNASANSVDSSVWRSPAPCLSQRRNNLRVFTFPELKTATKNFSRSFMVGEGGFGCVFKGVIKGSDDQSTRIDVAVKQLGKRGLQGHKEWVTEVNVLGVVEHPNLVRLLGYCADDDERGLQRLLIYEFMPNGSVADHLSTRSPTPLPWAMRLKIAQDTARGLSYLHEGMSFQIIFRDFKSSNILLDEQWNAKLSDFGLARLGPMDGLTHVSTAAVGTLGYAAPEYIQTGRLSYKNDVWSYGVFLYELITGRRPVDKNRPKSEQKLLEWIKPHLTDVKKFKMILDPRLEGNCPLKSVQRLAIIANQCLSKNPKHRPKMSEVVDMVHQVIEKLDKGESPQRLMKSFVSFENSQKDSPLKSGRGIVHLLIGENSWLAQKWNSKLARTR